MAPVNPQSYAGAIYGPAQPAQKTAVAKAIDYLLWLIWIGGLLSIAAGVACIVWLGQFWLGVKLIGCSVGAIILGTWFAFHYQLVVAICLIAGALWIVFDHFVTWNSVSKWIEKETAAAKKNL